MDRAACDRRMLLDSTGDMLPTSRHTASVADLILSSCLLRSISVRDVEAATFIDAYAQHLKRSGKFSRPMHEVTIRQVHHHLCGTSLRLAGNRRFLGRLRQGGQWGKSGSEQVAGRKDTIVAGFIGPDSSHVMDGVTSSIVRRRSWSKRRTQGVTDQKGKMQRL